MALYKELDPAKFRELLQKHSSRDDKESLLEVLHSERELIKKCINAGMSGKELHAILSHSKVVVGYSFFMATFKKFKEIENISSKGNAPFHPDLSIALKQQSETRKQ